MKVRHGFVSNSSSSSFCIIGTSNAKLIAQMAEKDGIVDDDGNILYSAIEVDHGVISSEDGKIVYINGYDTVETIRFAGVDAEVLLQNMSIQNAKEYMCNLMKHRYNTTSSQEQFSLFYGDCGNG